MGLEEAQGTLWTCLGFTGFATRTLSQEAREAVIWEGQGTDNTVAQSSVPE